MIVSFELPLRPTPKGRPRFARIGKFVRAYTPAKTERAEQDIITLLATYAPTGGPVERPINLTIAFYMPIPGWPAWKRAAAIAGAIKPTGRPDLDNLAKLVMDAMTRSGQWWKDDSQVVELTLRKEYGTRPHINVVWQTWDLMPTSAAEWKARVTTAMEHVA